MTQKNCRLIQLENRTPKSSYSAILLRTAQVASASRPKVDVSGLKLFLLRSPYMEIDDRRIEVKRRKALALLAYLAITGRTPAQGDDCHLALARQLAQSGAGLSQPRPIVSEQLNRARLGWRLIGKRLARNEKAGLWLDVHAFQASTG